MVRIGEAGCVDKFVGGEWRNTMREVTEGYVRVIAGRDMLYAVIWMDLPRSPYCVRHGRMEQHIQMTAILLGPRPLKRAFFVHESRACLTNKHEQSTRRLLPLFAKSPFRGCCCAKSSTRLSKLWTQTNTKKEESNCSPIKQLKCISIWRKSHFRMGFVAGGLTKPIQSGICCELLAHNSAHIQFLWLFHRTFFAEV